MKNGVIFPNLLQQNWSNECSDICRPSLMLKTIQQNTEIQNKWRKRVIFCNCINTFCIFIICHSLVVFLNICVSLNINCKLCVTYVHVTGGSHASKELFIFPYL